MPEAMDATSRQGQESLKRTLGVLKKPPYRRTMDDLRSLVAAFNGLAFFSELEQDVKQNVCRYLRLDFAEAGEVVFREGEPGDRFYIILLGTVGVYIRDVGAADVKAQGETDEATIPRARPVTPPSDRKAKEDTKLQNHRGTVIDPHLLGHNKRGTMIDPHALKQGIDEIAAEGTLPTAPSGQEATVSTLGLESMVALRGITLDSEMKGVDEPKGEAPLVFQSEGAGSNMGDEAAAARQKEVEHVTALLSAAKDAARHWPPGTVLNGQACRGHFRLGLVPAIIGPIQVGLRGEPSDCATHSMRLQRCLDDSYQRHDGDDEQSWLEAAGIDSRRMLCDQLGIRSMAVRIYSGEADGEVSSSPSRYASHRASLARRNSRRLFPGSSRRASRSASSRSASRRASRSATGSQAVSKMGSRRASMKFGAGSRRQSTKFGEMGGGSRRASTKFGDFGGGSRRQSTKLFDVGGSRRASTKFGDTGGGSRRQSTKFGATLSIDGLDVDGANSECSDDSEDEDSDEDSEDEDSDDDEDEDEDDDDLANQSGIGRLLRLSNRFSETRSSGFLFSPALSKRGSLSAHEFEATSSKSPVHSAKRATAQQFVGFQRESHVVDASVLERLNVYVHGGDTIPEEVSRPGSRESMISSRSSVANSPSGSRSGSLCGSASGSRSGSPEGDQSPTKSTGMNELNLDFIAGRNPGAAGPTLTLPGIASGKLAGRRASTARSPRGGRSGRGSRRVSKVEQRTMEVAVLRQGASFGEVALQNDAPRSATVKAKEACFFATLSREDYAAVLKTSIDKQKQERQTFLKMLPLLNDLAEQSIERLAALLQLRNMSRHELVHDYGAPVLQVYFIREGEFSVDCRIRLNDQPDDHSSQRPKGSNDPSAASSSRARTISVNPAGNQLHNHGHGHRSGHKRDRNHDHHDRFITTALLVPPATIGLAGYIQNERRYKTRVVCQSVLGSVYSILAKELVGSLSREQRTHLQCVAGARDQFYETRLSVLRHVQPRRARHQFTRGQRRWPQELTLIQRVHQTSGRHGQGNVYAVQNRLSLIGEPFQQRFAASSLKDPAGGDDGQPPVYRSDDHEKTADDKEKKEDALALTLKPQWRMEALAEMGSDACLPVVKAKSVPAADVPAGFAKSSQTIFHAGVSTSPRSSPAAKRLASPSSPELQNTSNPGSRSPRPATSPALQPQPSALPSVGAGKKRPDTSPASQQQAPREPSEFILLSGSSTGILSKEASTEDVNSLVAPSFDQSLRRPPGSATGTPHQKFTAQTVQPPKSARGNPRCPRVVAATTATSSKSTDAAPPNLGASLPAATDAGPAVPFLAAGLFSEHLWRDCEGGDTQRNASGYTRSTHMVTESSVGNGSDSKDGGNTPLLDLSCIYKARTYEPPAITLPSLSPLSTNASWRSAPSIAVRQTGASVSAFKLASPF